MTQSYRKKLIEVALPLEAINRESAREKSIRHGHPSTLHLWWSRKPLAACRAVLFTSIVDDPSSRPDLFATDKAQDAERARLFRIVEELVKWENTTNESVLEAARIEILRATDGNPPPVTDPFCGGGSIPLEAQRLGLEAHAGDLNPVAVLITKALVEIPPKFAGEAPVHPDARAKLGHSATWKGAQGLAEDVRYYGKWMRDVAFGRIGHLYPKAKLEDGREATVICWLWVRTVTCPNPACGSTMPLANKFELSKKRGKETYADPIVNGADLRFEVRDGLGAPSGTISRRGVRCTACGTIAPLDHARAEGRAGRMGAQMMAIVAAGDRARVYLAPNDEHQRVAVLPAPDYAPEAELSTHPQYMGTPRYGLTKQRDLYTPRQLVALMTFSELVGEARERIRADGATDAYADAVTTYLALALGRLAMTGNSLVRWNAVGEKAQHAFGRQALPMAWEFAEPNFFAAATGSVDAAVALVADPLELLGGVPAYAEQLDATRSAGKSKAMVITDPPYYDNVPYADLSDFFYVWLREAIGKLYPNLFSTLLVPKAQELVANVYRFDGDRSRANTFFEKGLESAFDRMREVHDGGYPMSVFYAFKQAESADEASSRASTGWETMLEGLLRSGFSVHGTWPIRTEMPSRMRNMASNALASSIILVCRPRLVDAPVTTRRDFVSSLRAELPAALRRLQHGNVAPVDLAQASIGPGMAVFSRYAKVIEASGRPMTVRTALGVINQALDEILAEQEGDFDADTRFAVAWFEQRGSAEGPYGEADVLARAKNTAVGGLEQVGILASRAGKVRLLGRAELPEGWDPATERSLTVWEVTQHLIRRLDTGGETAAAELLRRVGGLGETARELAYRLYTVCELKGWAQEALGYNALVVAWPEIARRVAGTPEATAQQTLEL